MSMKTIVISVLALLVLQHAVKFYSKLDYNKHIFNHYPGHCHQVQGMGIGSEDMHLMDNGIVFISSGFGIQDNTPAYDKFYAENNGKGRIYLFDMNNPKKEVQEMSLTSTKEFDKDRFQPHGISVWEDKKTGKLYLFAVNHERDGEEKIEKFLVSVAKLSLQHLKSYFGDPTIKKVNDVVATGDDSFYFTNSHSVSSYAGRMLELISLMARSDVGFHDGKGYRTVADGITVANGVQMSRDGKYVFVAGSMAQDLRIYERWTNNSLTLKQSCAQSRRCIQGIVESYRNVYPGDIQDVSVTEIPTFSWCCGAWTVICNRDKSYVFHTFPDNIMEDPVSGDLYIAFHPIGYLLFLHLADPSVQTPSQVLQVKLKEGTVSSVTELFVDDGHLVSGSSVAVVFKKKMLIGSVINKLVYCDVNVPL